MSPTLLIRADAGPQRGLGHVLRTCALAEAWRATGGAVRYVIAGGAAAVAARLEAAGCDVETLAVTPGSAADAAATCAAATRCGAAWVVLDGYHFGSDYCRAVRTAGLCLLVLDDTAHCDRYDADLLLNAVVGIGTAGDALRAAYATRVPDVPLLAGPQYALIRREFTPWCVADRASSQQGTRVVVSCGGSDATGLSSACLQALAVCTEALLDITVVVGAANAHVAALHTVAAASPHTVHLLENPPDLPRCFATADLALATASHTAWELAAVGTPAIVGTTAANQQCLAAALAEAGIVRHLGEWPSVATREAIATAARTLLADAAARAAMGRAGRALVDGEGAARVVQRLQGAPLWLRRACADDIQRLWEWANEPTTRAASFSSAPIPWQTHVAWFAARRADPDCALSIGVDAVDQPIGQWRVDRIRGEGVVSVGLAPNARGRGLGTALIRAGTLAAAYDLALRRCHAYIRPDNAASVAAFTKAGYREIAPTRLKDQPARHFVWDCE